MFSIDDFGPVLNACSDCIKLTERAQRVSGHLLNASLGDGNPLYTTTIALIRDLLAENAKLRAHAEAMANAPSLIELQEARLKFRAAFPETTDE